jgi:hypothetical protein
MQKANLNSIFLDAIPTNQQNALYLTSSPLGQIKFNEPSVVTPSLSLLFARMFHVFGYAACFSLPIYFLLDYLRKRQKTFSNHVKIPLHTQLGFFVSLCVTLAKEMCVCHFRATFTHCCKYIQAADREYHMRYFKYCLVEMIRKVVIILFNLKDVGISLYETNINSVADFSSLLLIRKWHKQWDRVREFFNNYEGTSSIPLSPTSWVRKPPVSTPSGVSLSFLIDYLEDIRCGHFSFNELLSSLCCTFEENKCRYLMREFNETS